MQLDATTKAAYDAATTANARAQVVITALADPVTVNVYNASDEVVGTGTMATPWATQANGTITIGEVTAFEVTTTGTPDADWYLRLESGTAYLQATFGLAGSGKEAVWSLDNWTDGQTGTIGTGTVTCVGNRAPTFTVAPTTASLSSSGGTIQFTATDANGDTVVYWLASRYLSSITINASTGLVTVPSSAAGTSGNITVRASDGTLTADATCAVTVAAASGAATYVIPASTSSRTLNGGSATGWSAFGPARAPTGGDIIELAAGTHGPITFVNIVGSESSRIIIRGPQSGTAQATVRRSAASGSGFIFQVNACRYVTIDGYLAGATEQCGLRVMYATNATPSSKDSPNMLVKYNDLPRDITIQYVELDGGYIPGSTSDGSGPGGDITGLQCHDNGDAPASGRWVENLKFLHLYIHNCGGQGLYLGPNYSTGSVPLRNIEAAYNRIEECGSGAIQGKCWFEGTNSIHDNIARRCGTAVTNQRSGLAILSGGGAVYNNECYDEGWNTTLSNAGVGGDPHGIQGYIANGPNPGVLALGYYGPYTSFSMVVYNNLVVSPGNATLTSYGETANGITFGRDSTARVPINVSVYNNTVVDATGRSIIVNSAMPGFVRNNVCTGNATDAPSGSGATVSDNATGVTLTAEYRLTSENAAAGTFGVHISTSDLDGVSRAGTASKGAYEFA